MDTDGPMLCLGMRAHDEPRCDGSVSHFGHRFSKFGVHTRFNFGITHQFVRLTLASSMGH